MVLVCQNCLGEQSEPIHASCWSCTKSRVADAGANLQNSGERSEYCTTATLTVQPDFYTAMPGKRVPETQTACRKASTSDAVRLRC